MKAFSRATLLFLVASSTLIFTGCPNNPTPPDPSITAVAGGTGAQGRGGAAGLDWLTPQNVRDANDVGLQTRDPAFSRGLDGDGMGSGMLEGILSPIYFGFDSASVRPEDQPSVEEAAAYLFDNPGSRLLIEGHCDWRGTPEYNLALGDRRAASVREFLLQLGIEPNRVETVSKGDLEAVTDGNDRQMAQDRRADLIVVQ